MFDGNMNGAEQVRASNATEELAAGQIELAFNHGFDCTNPAHGEAYDRYVASAQRTVSQHLPSNHLSSYDLCVRVAGNALLDLTKTLTDDSGLWNMSQPDQNHEDIIEDPTGGSFSYYSPTSTQWGDTDDSSTILGALSDGTTAFPTAGNLESTIVCGGMFPFFCIEDEEQVKHATMLQIVVVDGISGNDCGGNANVPQFIFFRFRETDEPSVVYGP